MEDNEGQLGVEGGVQGSWQERRERNQKGPC